MATSDQIVEPQIREINARIARQYDEFPYEPKVGIENDPAVVLGLAAFHGRDFGLPDADAQRPLEILDLGCGAGAQLEYLGKHTQANVVGVDLSSAACAAARRRCRKFGSRIRVVCADLVDMTAESLGKFDLIYSIGVIYVTPPAVRQHVLALIADCLKPNGVAVISYYAGTISAIQSAIYRLLQAVVDPALPHDEKVRQAREIIRHIAKMSTANQRLEVVEKLLETMQSLATTVLFHEAFNDEFSTLDTMEIAKTLRNRGVHFLNYLGPIQLGAAGSPTQRALTASALDLVEGGGYRHAVFCKQSDMLPLTPATASALLWRTSLVRKDPDRGHDGPIVYRELEGPGVATLERACSQAMLDELAAGPKSWTAICEGVARRFATRGMAFEDSALKMMESDLLYIWQHRLAIPVLGQKI